MPVPVRPSPIFVFVIHQLEQVLENAHPIRAIHVEVKQEYGWPKMWKELVARGMRVGKERVRRTMQEHGIKAIGLG